MSRQLYILSLIFILFFSGSVFAATKTYRYKCPKSKLIQEYATPGVKKCPNDGRTMQRIN